MVQEVGHLCDLWAHSSDPNNVMTDQGGGTADQITPNQCCMISTSRFVSATPCGPIEIPLDLQETDIEAPIRIPILQSNALQVANRKEPGSQPTMPSRVAQASLAVLVLVVTARSAYRRLAGPQ